MYGRLPLRLAWDLNDERRGLFLYHTFLHSGWMITAYLAINTLLSWRLGCPVLPGTGMLFVALSFVAISFGLKKYASGQATVEAIGFFVAKLWFLHGTWAALSTMALMQQAGCGETYIIGIVGLLSGLGFVVLVIADRKRVHD